MEIENDIYNDNNNDHTEVEDIVNNESIKAKIEMLLFIYQMNGSFINNNYTSIDDLIEDITDKIYNLLKQQLIFYSDYDIAFNKELRDVVKNRITEYFEN